MTTDDDEEDDHEPMRHLVWWWFQSGRPLRRSSASTRLSWVLSNLSVSAKYVDIDWNSDYFAQCLHWASLPSLCSQERCLMVRLQTSPVPNSIKSWKLKMPNVLWFFAFLHTHMRLTNYLATLSSSSFRSFILRSNLGSFGQSSPVATLSFWRKKHLYHSSLLL